MSEVHNYGRIAAWRSARCSVYSWP